MYKSSKSMRMFAAIPIRLILKVAPNVTHQLDYYEVLRPLQFYLLFYRFRRRKFSENGKQIAILLFSLLNFSRRQISRKYYGKNPYKWTFQTIFSQMAIAMILTSRFTGLWAERSPMYFKFTQYTVRTCCSLLNALPFILILKTFDTEGAPSCIVCGVGF